MRFLDHDNYTGITEHIVKVDGKNVVKKSQDVNEVIKDNKRKLGATSDSWQGEFHHVASIPLIVVEQWREELRAKGANNINPLARENKAYFIAKINSSDFSAFRTKAGRI